MRRLGTTKPLGTGLAGLAALATAATLALTGCGSESDPEPERSSSGSFPVTVGTTTVDQRPTRIVSLSPTATEILFAIGAGEQVTAVDDQSDHPESAPMTDLSGFKPNAEAVAARTPDLVVVSHDTDKIVDQLTTLKIPVYLAEAADSLDDMYQQMDELGALTGHRGEAGDLVTTIKTDIESIVN